ncbi:MYSc [Nesidiocoris tenuis]|uniref:non-specific serine/threonine protein kinase n=1 Tax=Nesidiocoris tenuis TaxID=355587 RepID=A0ABN7AJ46_9HEMI|nr:MYSc [Nesidiocoris tenuis]
MAFTSSSLDLDSAPEPDSRLVLDQLIGEGTYGEVYSARFGGERVAVKILENIAENIEEIQVEFKILRDLCHHPNLPIFHGVFLRRAPVMEQDQLWFVLEMCNGGSVTDLVQGLIRHKEVLLEHQIAYILHETVQALVFLHNNNCIHRDIKGHNILLTENADIKLVDFGVSSQLRHMNERRNTSVGTPYWMAPEVIACEQQENSWYDTRCDVWSLGITAIELAEGDPPLSNLHPMRALFQIPGNPPPRLQRKDCLLLSEFISQILVKDIEFRPYSKHLLGHLLIRKGAEYAHKAKHELKKEILRQRIYGRHCRQPEITTKHGKLKSHKRYDQKILNVDDLVTLGTLTEDVLVDQLHRRFDSDQIYTYIGDILIAVNPYSTLGLYTTMKQKIYQKQSRCHKPPHIFAIADAAYQMLVSQKTNQSIVISGESGAGKTESGNLLLKQLVFLGKVPNSNLEERILKMNPLLEAFGNAQTGINSNSSRFGKFLELSFLGTGKVTGAKVNVYLLEQSRIVQQTKRERNFHVFYYIYEGILSEERHREFYLDSDARKTHKYLNLDQDDYSARLKNLKMYSEVKNAFHTVGFQKDEINSVYNIIFGIIHLGDVIFTEVVSHDNTDNKSKIYDLTPLYRACNLLGVDPHDALECLLENTVSTRGETIVRSNSVVEASATRDSLVKVLYRKLFNWIVNRINGLLSSNKKNDHLTVGILDIFGFENFEYNSFEQLCINIANEQIQYFFNQHIFTWEQQEYMAEGIAVDLVEFSDNRPVLDMLLSRQMGLLALLDEESRFPRASDKSLIEKFHANIKSKLYIRPKSNALCFGIMHYAGRVIYQAEGFLNKNRQVVGSRVLRLLRSSDMTMVKNLLHSSPENGNNLKGCYDYGGPNRPQQTAAMYFRHSLMELLQKMVNGQPQFVRCVKPNDARLPHVFDSVKVQKQLRYIGVMETVRIRQQGFSHRITFHDFLTKYGFLVFRYNDKIRYSHEYCRALLQRLAMTGWALGKTKVFLKYFHIEFLTKLREEKIKKIVLAQSCIRGWLARVKYKRLRRQLMASVVTLQRNVRGKAAQVNQTRNEVSSPWGNVKMRPITQHNINKISENNLWRCVENNLDNKQRKHEKDNKSNKNIKNSQQKDESPKNPKREVDRQPQLAALCNDIFKKNKEFHIHLRNNAVAKNLADIKYGSANDKKHSRSNSSCSSDARIEGNDDKQRLRQLRGGNTTRACLDSEGELANHVARGKKNPNSEDFEGPYNFRRLLRPTAHPPTESLRKRIVTRCRLYDLTAL